MFFMKLFQGNRADKVAETLHGFGAAIAPVVAMST